MAESAPTVSVIIPCYKQARFVGDAVRSALAQTSGGIEVVLVDDGSPDDTAAVAATFGDRIRYIRQDNAGASAARNTGFEASRGRFVLFLDADDVLEPRLIERSLAALAERPDAALTCAGWNAVDLEGRVVAPHPPVEWEAALFHQLVKGNPAPPCCWLVRREVQEKVGPWCPDLAINGHQDWEWVLRAAAMGMKFATTRGAIALYRTYSDSMSGDRIRMYLGRMEVFRRYRATHADCRICAYAFRRAMLGSRLRLSYDLARGLFRSRSVGDVSRVTRDAARALRGEPTFPLSLLVDATVVGWRRALRAVGIR